MTTPPRYQNASYDDVPDNIKRLMREMKVNSKGIYIHGGVGCGKTHIAYALSEKYESVMGAKPSFWNTTELFEEIKDDYDRHYTDKTNILEAIMDYDKLLFLDDIGSEKPTEWVQERFYLLINKRYNEMRPTVYTSNYSVGELAARLGDRIVSRIVETCEIVKLEGVDRRLEN